MQGALARHDEILRDAIAAHDGHIVKTTGDGVHAAFAARDQRGRAARRCATRARARALGRRPGRCACAWGSTPAPRSSATATTTAPRVNRAARLMSVANGGQVVVSLTTEELLRDDMPEGCTLVDLGEHRLRDLARAERVFQLCSDGLGVRVRAAPIARRVRRQPSRAAHVVPRARGRAGCDRRRAAHRPGW